jgi:hypothetical protein
MNNNYITSDIAIASYLMMKGMTLLDARRERGGRFRFEFSDPQNLAQKYAVEYVNSESAKFDAHMKNLKNIIFKN